MKALAASLATAAVLAGVAWASNVTPAQVSKLNARVTALEASQTGLLSYINLCLHTFQAASQFGDVANGAGYVYRDRAGDQLNTAIDFVDTGLNEKASFYLPTPAVDCSKMKP